MNSDVIEKPNDNLVITPVSTQTDYPLLKPITFTNLIEDDYLES